MKQEEDLLLKYLCMALPYHPILHFVGKVKRRDEYLCGFRKNSNIFLINDAYYVDEVKPYLRPMSSITEDEKREIYNWLAENDVDWSDFSKLKIDKILISFDSSWLLVNWLLEHHFDFMGLISKGVAIKVTNENNPYKN